MKYKISIASLALAFLFAVEARAQLDPTLYFMKDLPLNNQLNPAFQPKNGSIYIGFPVLTSFSTNVALQGEQLTIGNWFGSPPNYEALATAPGDFGVGGVTYNQNILNFGFMVKDMYFTFDANVKVVTEGRITKDMEKLLWYGNGAPATIGQQLSMNGLGATGYIYGELALGFSKAIIKNQLFAGGKAKLLLGGAYAQASMSDGSFINTDPNTYNITVGFNPDIRLSGIPLNVPKGEFTLDSLVDTKTDKLKLNTNNTGVAFDLGGSWDLPWVKGLNVSASVLNIGFINWDEDKIVAVDPKKTFTFQGFDVEEGKEFGEILKDSIMQLAEVTSTHTSTRRWLYPTIYAGVNYHPWKYLNFGALFGYQYTKFEGLPMFALSMNTESFPVNGSVSYSYYNKNHNLGLGLLFGHKYVQLHVIADNILLVKYSNLGKGGDAKSLINDKVQQANVRVGVNFLFGKGREKRNNIASAAPVNAPMAPTSSAADSVTSSNDVEGKPAQENKVDATQTLDEQKNVEAATEKTLTPAEKAAVGTAAAAGATVGAAEVVKSNKEATATNEPSKEDLINKAKAEEKAAGQEPSPQSLQ